MSTKRTKVLSFLMALVFMFGTISPCLTIADDIDQTPTPEPIIETIDNVDEAQQVEGGGEEETENEIHIISGFDVEFDEETGVQLPLFEFIVDANTKYINIDFPKAVKGFFDGDEEHLVEIDVDTWQLKEAISDNVEAYVPVFDETKYAVKDDANVPFGYVTRMESTEVSEENNSDSEIESPEILEEVSGEQTLPEGNSSEAVIDDATDSEPNDSLYTIDSSENNSEEQAAVETQSEDREEETNAPVEDDKAIEETKEDSEAVQSDTSMSEEDSESNAIKTITGFKFYRDETTGDVLPEANVLIDNGTAYDSIQLPKTVTGYIDGKEDESIIEVSKWVEDESLSDEDKKVYMPTFDSSVFSVNENIVLPYIVVEKYEKPSSEEIKPVDAKPSIGSGISLKAIFQQTYTRGLPSNYFTALSNEGTTVASGGTGAQSRIVWLPQNYDSSKKYNVVILMHGNSDQARHWMTSSHSINGTNITGQRLFAHMTDEGYIPRTIFVSIHNNTVNYSAANILSHIQYVISNYSTYASGTSVNDIQNAACHFAIVGFSSGGIAGENFFESYKGVVNNYLLFSVVGNKDNFFSTPTSAYGNAKHLIMAAGSSDRYGPGGKTGSGLTETRRHFDALTPYVDDATFLTFDGAHEWDVWFSALYRGLPSTCLHDPPVTGTLAITKSSGNTSITNGNSNYSLAGAVYTVYTAASGGTNKGTITTGSNGAGTSTLTLNPGTYYVEETTAPAGYVKNTGRTAVTITAGKTTTLTTGVAVDNPIVGSVQITKSSANTSITNGNSNYSIAGAKYTLKNTATNATWTLTTGTNGVSNKVTGLPLGNYEITETTASTGYVKNTGTHTFTITASSKDKAFTASDNAIYKETPITGSVQITKSSANTSVTNGNNNYSVVGAKYTLTNTDTNAKWTLTTSTGGVSNKVTGLPLGNYKIEETTASAGYSKNNGTHTFTITASSYDKSFTASHNAIYKENPITGAVNITKSSANTSITNGNSNYSLAGAVYKLVGNGKTYTFPATDANGKASLTGLPLGSYTLSEVTPPKGYKANSNTYTVTISNATAVNISASNTDALKDEPILGQFKIKKASAVPSITNGNSCYSLAGAEYKLYKSDGTFVATLTTNANGEATKTGLALGSYYLVETKASQGYAVSTGRKEFTLTSANLETFTGGIFNETPLNDPIAALVYKVDADTRERVPQGGASLAGAQFTVKYYDALYDTVPASATPKYTWVFQTDEDGFVAFSEMYKVSGPALPVNSDGAPCVPIGTITIQETLPPVGYLINDTVYTYKIDSENGMLVARYPSIEINETVKKGRFTIEKYTMDTKSGSIDAAAAQASAELEQGAIFQVIDKDGEVVDTLTTGANGRATTIDLPYGTYKIHQISGATGYFFIDDTTVSITENGENKLYKLYNDRKNAAIHVVKKDAETGAVIKVSGVTFEIYDSANNKLTIGGQSSFTTNANGEFTTAKQLPYGSYTLKETVAPEGYALPTTSISFTINDSNYGSGLIEVVAFDAKASCEINLYKTGLVCTGLTTVTENGETVTKPVFAQGYLTGVVFSLYAKTDILNNNGTVKYTAGTHIADATTESDGHAHFRGLQSGTYEVRETSTLNGYILLTAPIEVVCDLGTAQSIVVVAPDPINNQLKDVSISFLKQKEVFTVANGSGSYSYQAGNGFTFGLYSAEALTVIGSGTTYTIPANTLLATAVSDASGNINFAGYYPVGNYYVKEIAAPDSSYIIDNTQYPVVVTMTNTAPQTVVIDNTSTPINNDLYKADVKVIKKDAETGNVIPLAGATFEIRNSSNVLVATVITDATGHAETAVELPYGTYSIKETVPPAGYVLDSTENSIVIDSTTVQSDGTSEYVEYEAEDTRIKGKITAVKKGEALTSTNVVTENGQSVTKLVFTEEFLPNVKIDLYAAADIVFLGEVKYAAGTRVASGTTNSSGRLEFNDLYLGDYELREVESASDVYVLPSQNEHVTLTSTNNTVDVVEQTVNMSNVLRDVELSFIKKVPSISTTTNGENVTTTISTDHADYIAATEEFVFGLYNSTAIAMYNNTGTVPANTLLATATVGQNGVVSFDQKLPEGSYYIKELVAPDKYELLTEIIDGFTIIPGDLKQNSIEINLNDVYNELITVDMSIYKYDEDTDAPLNTALFEIKDNDTGVVLFKGRTNDSGMLGPVSIYPGNFTLTELEAPEDYDIAAPIVFTVTTDGKVMVGEDEIENGKFNIPNEYINIPDVTLPRTGSISAVLLTAFGGIITLSGTIFIIVNKRKNEMF